MPGVYSTAKEATAKKSIDDVIKAAGVPIDMADERYLRALVGHAAGEPEAVKRTGTKLQFFIVRGGAEGFLDGGHAAVDAGRIVTGGGLTTSGQPASARTTMIFDDNDLLAVFDANGKLVSSALLRRPLAIMNPDIWTEKTANRIYDAWDGQWVSLYHNTSFNVKYYGLKVDDNLGWYASGKVRVDMHKEEATNGCIFIRDPATPAYSESNTAPLSNFEPKLIRDVQAAIKAKTGQKIGKMRMAFVSKAK